MIASLLCDTVSPKAVFASRSRIVATAFASKENMNLCRLILVSFSILFSGNVSAKEQPVTLRDLVRGAELIVVGVVRSIDDERIATIDVELQLRGAPVRTVRFIAFPTWVCDDTRVHVGQRALLALGPRQPSLSKSIPDDVRQVLFSGAGEIEISGADAIVNSPPLLLPSSVRGSSRSDAPYSNMVLWSDLLHEITRCVSKPDACRNEGVVSYQLPRAVEQRQTIDSSP